MLQQRETTIAAGDNIRLFARIETPAKPLGCLVISHGFGEHCGRYSKLVDTLMRIGVTTIRYDLRGHGHSGGKRGHASSYEKYLDDLDHVIELARDVSPALPTFLFGHSMGGGLVLNYALRRGGNLAGIISSSPWLRLAFPPPAWKVLLAQMIVGVLPGFRIATNLDATKLSHDPEVAKTLEQDSLANPVMSAAAFVALIKAGEYASSHAGSLRLPLLLMHGGADAITDIRASEVFFAAAGMTDKTFKRWDGMYHETLNETDSEPVYQMIVDWLKPRLKAAS